MHVTVDQMMRPSTFGPTPPTLGAFDSREERGGRAPIQRGPIARSPRGAMRMNSPRGFAQRGVFGARRDANFRGNRFEARGIGVRNGFERGGWRGGGYWPQGVPYGGYGAMPPGADAGMQPSQPGGQGGGGAAPDDSQASAPPQQDAGSGQDNGRHQHEHDDQGGGGGGFSLHSIPTWGYWVAGGLGTLLLLRK